MASENGSGRRGRLTVAGIARLAGVSAPTVSRVLNGQTGVALGTRRRVEAVLREHGYQRPSGADRAPLIELVFHALDSLWALELIQGVEEVARENELALVLTQMQGRLTPGKAWTEQVLSRRPHGVIAVLADLTTAQQHQLSSRSVPLVTVDPTGEPLHETPSVGATNWTGALVAARHLLDLGHRRIAMLGGNQRWPFCRARLDGFRAALELGGVPVDPALVRIGPLYVDGGLREATALLQAPEPPSAILATNDLQAHGVYEAARRLGVRIPEDLSVVGFDDIEVASLVDPALTTVAQDKPGFGTAAAGALLAMIDNAGAPEPVRLPTKLVVRDSCGPTR